MTDFKKLKTENILPILAASAALRKVNDLLALINLAESRNINFMKIYETLLQNYLFTGYPSALVSLKILKSVYPDKQIRKMSDMNLYHFKRIGVANCKKVYGQKYNKLINNIKSFSPDISEWLVLEGYGKVMGRKGLSFKERELCIVAVLAVLRFEDQLYSHINGAFRAKASVMEIKDVINYLELLGRKNLSSFGLRVLKRFKAEKGM
ncbi:MAG: hypothetical protein DAHOPDDO_00670 [Ignavibacteriaceae bacterium]|nr:hypothetical protein [Ignavibacteriaceae bacterium]